MAKIHDLFIIELAEVIKGYGNDPDVKDPFRLSEFYRFYELPNIAVSRENFEKMRPAQPEQRWIPCSERLPVIKEHHVSEPCIVYCSNGAYGFAELEENIFGQVGWNCERDDEYHEPLGEVLAWMPLPEPWKGEER